jgi:hypothetical protein
VSDPGTGEGSRVGYSSVVTSLLSGVTSSLLGIAVRGPLGAALEALVGVGPVGVRLDALGGFFGHFVVSHGTFLVSQFVRVDYEYVPETTSRDDPGLCP